MGRRFSFENIGSNAVMRRAPETEAAFNSQGDSPDLRRVVWSPDQSRRLAADEITKIQAKDAGEEFPATCGIYFYIRRRMTHIPDQVFRSTMPVHMRATELQTFNPHVDKVYNAVARSISRPRIGPLGSR